MTGIETPFLYRWEKSVTIRAGGARTIGFNVRSQGLSLGNRKTHKFLPRIFIQPLCLFPASSRTLLTIITLIFSAMSMRPRNGLVWYCADEFLHFNEHWGTRSRQPAPFLDVSCSYSLDGAPHIFAIPTWLLPVGRTLSAGGAWEVLLSLLPFGKRMRPSTPRRFLTALLKCRSPPRSESS